MGKVREMIEQTGSSRGGKRTGFVPKEREGRWFHSIYRISSVCLSGLVWSSLARWVGFGFVGDLSMTI